MIYYLHYKKKLQNLVKLITKMNASALLILIVLY